MSIMRFKQGRECDIYKIESDCLCGEFIITNDTKSVFVCYEDGVLTKVCSGQMIDCDGKVYSYDEFVDYMFDCIEFYDETYKMHKDRIRKLEDQVTWLSILVALLYVGGLLICVF